MGENSRQLHRKLINGDILAADPVRRVWMAIDPIHLVSTVIYNKKNLVQAHLIFFKYVVDIVLQEGTKNGATRMRRFNRIGDGIVRTNLSLYPI